MSIAGCLVSHPTGSEIQKKNFDGHPSEQAVQTSFKAVAGIIKVIYVIG